MYAPGDKLLFLPENEIVIVIEDRGHGQLCVRDTLGLSFWAYWDRVRKLTPLEEVL